MKDHDQYHHEAIGLLKKLIKTPSLSREEDQTAQIINTFLAKKGISTKQKNNNIYCYNQQYDPDKPTLLLNSHHDTVRPNAGYNNDPLDPIEKDGKLYGLGSNDAGGCLVSLVSTFCHFYKQKDLSHNILLIASGEEEVSGPNGIASVLSDIKNIDLAIVGEPTLLDMAIAEKGLIVYDAEISGTPSHAAHTNNDNSIYNCINALDWVRTYRFEKDSTLLGPVHLTATQINGGKQHNVVPAKVDIVLDVRVNDQYTNQEIDDLLIANAPFALKARSLRLNSSSIPETHPLVKIGKSLGAKTYGSPTLSDQYALTCPSLKMGPGDSTRSHMADEFIYIDEIKQGINTYIHLLENFLKS